MKEDACRPVLAVKLRDSKDNSWGHVVAWDGNIIHDNPHSCKVELESDLTRKGSKRRRECCVGACALQFKKGSMKRDAELNVCKVVFH